MDTLNQTVPAMQPFIIMGPFVIQRPIYSTSLAFDDTSRIWMRGLLLSVSLISVGNIEDEVSVQKFHGMPNYRIGTPGVFWTYPIQFRLYYGKDAPKSPG